MLIQLHQNVLQKIVHLVSLLFPTIEKKMVTLFIRKPLSLSRKLANEQKLYLFKLNTRSGIDHV